MFWGAFTSLRWFTMQGRGVVTSTNLGAFSRSKILSLFLEMCIGHFGKHSGNRRTHKTSRGTVFAASELYIVTARCFSRNTHRHKYTIIICTRNIRVNNTTKPTGLRRNVWIINRRRHAQVSVARNINYAGHSSSKFGTHPHTHRANSLLIIIHACPSALSRSKRSCSLCTYNCLPPTNSLLAERHYPSSILQDAPRIHLADPTQESPGNARQGWGRPDDGMPPTGFSRRIQFRRPRSRV